MQLKGKALPLEFRLSWAFWRSQLLQWQEHPSHGASETPSTFLKQFGHQTFEAGEVMLVTVPWVLVLWSAFNMSISRPHSSGISEPGLMTPAEPFAPVTSGPGLNSV